MLRMGAAEPVTMALVLFFALAGEAAAAEEGLGRRWAKIYRGLQTTPWGDHYRRHRYRPGDGTAERIRKHVEDRRRLMEVTDPDTDKPYGSDPSGTYTPRMDGKAKVNGVLFDYSALDCPWEKALDPDYPAMCLPYQQILSPVPADVLPTADVFKVPGGLVGNFSARDETFYMPDGSRLECSDEIERLTGARCAAGNAALGHGAICKGIVEDCSFSKPHTRKCDNGKCKEWQKKTTCSGSGCAEGYPEDIRLSYPATYPGNNGGAFEPHADEDKAGECSKSDSALQWLKCGIPCPLAFPMETKDFTWSGIIILAFIVLSMIHGCVMIFKVKGDPQNFFIAGRNLPTWVLVCTLASQCLDTNSCLANLDLAYKFHWWDGAAIPLGLSASLIIVGVFLAKPINEMKVLTLPDCFARVYGEAAEVMVSVVTLVSFIFLLAGNLVGTGKIISYLFGIDPALGIAIATFIIWAYSCAGGLFSVAYADIMQAAIGWTGFIVATSWIQANMPNHPGVSPSYPQGDKPVISEGIVDADAYDPLPTAIFFNWVTFFVLAFGNCMALDFQQRCIAAKTGNAARVGCILAGIVSVFLGLYNTGNGGVTRALYGPSSPHAEFVANSCSADITIIGCFGGAAADPSLNRTCNAVPLPGVPTCGEWKPDPYATLKMLTCTKPECHPFVDFDGSAGYGAGHEANFPMSAFIGTWYLVGIVAATMSTADGAIVAMGTVFAHNLCRKTGQVSDKNLLKSARACTLLFSIISGLIAMTKPNETGYFLVVAFDVVLAAGVVPLFALIYWKGIKPEAGFLSLLAGAIVRVVLEFALPKDGLLLIAGKFARNFGPGIQDPEMFDEAVMFGKMREVCPQERLLDLTGVDSLVSPAVCLLVLPLVHFLPIRNWGGRWFTPVPAEDAAVPEGGEREIEGRA